MKKFLSVFAAIIVAVMCVSGFSGCSKKLVGFDIDLAREVCKELDIKVEFKEINWDTKETELEVGTIDCVWNGFTYTQDRDDGYYDEDRKQQIGGLAFSKFYMENKQVAVVTKANASSYSDVSSFAGKRGCAEATSAGDTVISTILNGTTNQLERQLDVFTAVSAGTYDYGVIDSSMASQYIVNENGTYNSSLAVVEIADVEKEYYAIGFKEGSNLPDVFDYVLAKLYKNETAKNIAKTYALDGVLFNGFDKIDTENYVLPTDGAYKAIKDKNKIVIGYTIFAPMAYFTK